MPASTFPHLSPLNLPSWLLPVQTFVLDNELSTHFFRKPCLRDSHYRDRVNYGQKAQISCSNVVAQSPCLDLSSDIFTQLALDPHTAVWYLGTSSVTGKGPSAITFPSGLANPLTPS